MKSIRLVIADLDGTLLDPQHRVTPAAFHAVCELRDAGILFTLVSGRPPFGMRMCADTLNIKMPISGFNGGSITAADFSPLRQLTLPTDISREIMAYFERKKINYWIYRGSDWMVLDPRIPHAIKEANTVEYRPSVVRTFLGRWEGLSKIVGISDKPDYLAECEQEARALFRGQVSAARSQPYYLDVTHRDANKEVFVDYLSKLHSISRDQIATIGDMPSDLPMFRSCGLAIAMGNALDSVKADAHHVTRTNTQEGFAYAMRNFVLTRRIAA